MGEDTDFYTSFISFDRDRSGFFMSISSIFQRMTKKPVHGRGMAFDMDLAVSDHAVSDRAALLDRLDDALCAASELNLSLLSKIVAGACTRTPILAGAQKNRTIRLAEVGAWTDAAFALIDLELPNWKVRRLAYEDGEWFCCLSQQPNLPMTLDDCAEATHTVLPLAILRALVEARRMACVTTEIRSTVPQVRSAPMEHFVCCDNFA